MGITISSEKKQLLTAHCWQAVFPPAIVLNSSCFYLFQSGRYVYGDQQGTAKLVSIDEKPNFRTYVVTLPDYMLRGWRRGRR